MSSIRDDYGGGDVNEQGNGQRDDWRDREPFDTKKYRNFYQLAGGVFIIIVILIVGGFIYSNPNSGYWVNIYATAAGTILTIAVLDRRAEQRAIRERKEELIWQLSSHNNSFATEAARLLALKKWLYDGSLINSTLRDANLEGCKLRSADMQDADLRGANLKRAELDSTKLDRADFEMANMEGCSLRQANLRATNFHDAILKNANLWRANMQKSNLIRANLRGADLSNANLVEAEIGLTSNQSEELWEKDFQMTLFDSYTTLPNGSRWTLDQDMQEFTDPNHPNFWRPDV